MSLEGPQDALTVNTSNLLAFDDALSWEIKRIKGGVGAMVSGSGLFNLELAGQGTRPSAARESPWSSTARSSRPSSIRRLPCAGRPLWLRRSRPMSTSARSSAADPVSQSSSPSTGPGSSSSSLPRTPSTQLPEAEALNARDNGGAPGPLCTHSGLGAPPLPRRQSCPGSSGFDGHSLLGSPAFDPVVPEGGEDQRACQDEHDHCESAAGSCEGGSCRLGDRSVEDVCQARTADHDDVEDALHPTTHVMGRGLQEHRRSEGRGDDIGAPTQTEPEQRCDEGECPEAGGDLEREPEQNHRRTPDDDR